MHDEIRTYLMEHRATGDVGTFTDDDSLLETGVIDSVAMVDLVGFLESRFSIKIDEDDMTPENFDSVSAIVAYVNRVRSA